MDERTEKTQRINRCTAIFTQLYGTAPSVISRAPGRAEILGCHTDYNSGFALAAGIDRDTYCLAASRPDGEIHVYSTAYPDGTPVSFSVNSPVRDSETTWTNYIRAVIRELIRAGFGLKGADLLVDSTVPKSGGVSSSAALELSVAFALMKLFHHAIDRTQIALLCKTAENSDLVRSPCGFLDQGASAFARKDSLVFLDFLPDGNSPVSKVESIPAKFPVAASFIIPVDTSLERQLGETGYVARRKMCEDSLPFWSSSLGRPVHSLREVSVAEFESNRATLESVNPVMRKRVEHIVMENARVLEAIVALRNKDIHAFGNLLTAGGKSSLELYDLDENTPQLTFLVTHGRELPGVLGMRNMGGGFSAIALALVRDEAAAEFKKSLSRAYTEKFKGTLGFIEFTPSEGAEIVYG